ncbi:nucleoside 2-deoxyribosyltransferase [Marinobacteraceae bacterium S3BR75-40.1]
MQVYLAGPDVFLADARAIGQRKCERLQADGLQGRFPLDAELDLEGLTPREMGRRIFNANRELMDRCQAALVHLTPFRGPSADAGTVLEVGYLFARGVPIIGYSGDARPYAARVAGPRRHWDADDMRIEHFDLPDNLMIPLAIEASSGEVVTAEGHQMSAAEAARDMGLFDRAVKALVQRVGRRPAD